ncbi:MAG: DegV family protein [Clostridia bacterium]|nr:DegV family protein [Clostridia bacterium]
MFKIFSDTPCDFTLEYAESIGVSIVPLYVSFDGENYSKAQYELTTEDFYNRMTSEKVYPKTSMPSVQDYIDYFLPYVKENTPIIAITISTLFSGSFNSANMAADQIREDYPDAQITVINSQLNSAAQGLLVYEAVRMNRDNVPYETVIKVLEEMTKLGTVYFVIEGLDYLQTGGRIGKVASLITGMLNIRPVLYMNNGEISISSITRTRKKSVTGVFEGVKRHFQTNNIDPSTYEFTTGSSDISDTGMSERKELRNRLESELGVVCLENRENVDMRVSMITGCHTGSYTTGIGYMPKYEAILPLVEK